MAYTYELGSDYGVVLLGEYEDIGDCDLRFRSIEDADTAQLSRLEVVMAQSLKTVYCESRCDALRPKRKHIYLKSFCVGENKQCI